MRRKHNSRTHAASSVPDVLGFFDRSLEVRRQLFEDEVGVCDIVAGGPPDISPDRPTTLTFGDEAADLSSLLAWLTKLAGRDAWTFYVHHHDNIVVDLALLEPYRQAGFCRRLRLFRTNPADEGGTNLLGVSAPDRAWVLVLNNDNQGKFRIDFFGPAPLCHSLRSHLG